MLSGIDDSEQLERLRDVMYGSDLNRSSGIVFTEYLLIFNWGVPFCLTSSTIFL
jgi:hypothetical protein